MGEWPLIILGYPLGGNPRNDSFWEPVVKKIAKRLEGLRKSCLSKGGRLALIPSVLDSIPIYYLSIIRIPKKKLLSKLNKG